MAKPRRCQYAMVRLMTKSSTMNKYTSDATRFDGHADALVQCRLHRTLGEVPLDAVIGQVFAPYSPYACSSINPNVPVCPSSLNAVADMLPTCQKTRLLVCHVGTLGDTFLHHVGEISSDMLATCRLQHIMSVFCRHPTFAN